jgi:sulfur carrier protein
MSARPAEGPMSDTEMTGTEVAEVTVNGVAHTITGAATIELLVARLMGPARAGLAVAVNGEVLSRECWSERLLADGDDIEILTAFQGG